METVYINIGTRMRHLREMRGWTQADLAQKLGLTRTSVVNIEAGRQRVMLHILPAMALVFKLSPENFIRGLWN